MASSSNPSATPLARQGSFLGALKNIVAAPLTWLAGADQDDHSGKRRREHVVPDPERGSSSDDDDDGRQPNKRMRMQSSPKQAPQAAYLDPPSAAFRQQPKRRIPAPIARSSSSSASILPRSHNLRPNVPRSSFTPTPLVRTMSIDPPLIPLPLHREASINDVVMESSPASSPMSMCREESLPPAPLASMPSFRMRSSLTPQPQLRELSEPPPVSSLSSNPKFVRAPLQQKDSRPVQTLGTLVENQRSDHPVSGQPASSTLFGTSLQPESSNRRAESAPVERALFELDIYKTPLLPSRLRSANQSSTAATIPDLFKSRRNGRLVLMDDDRKKESPSHKSPQAHGSKPYAGEGGMKKLLARRKQEEDEIDDEMGEFSDSKPNCDNPGEKSEQAPAPPPPPPASSSDWFAVASAGASSGGSSLRVGRSKISRNHIARPAAPRPSRLKFSAVYEEEGDDAMDGEDEARQKEYAMLEEASKKLPSFHVPAGFSFAKPEATPLQNDLTNAKEPPITSLPFSLGKPSSQADIAKPEASTSSVKENSEIKGSGTEPNVSAAPKTFRSFADAPPLSVATPSESSESNSKSSEPTSKPTNPAPGPSGIPNFFASSAIVAKPLNLPPVPPMSLPSSTSSPFGNANKMETPATTSTAPIGPAHDKENPFWEGDKVAVPKPDQAPSKPVGLFSAPSATSSAPSTSSSSSSTFTFGQPSVTPTPTAGPFGFAPTAKPVEEKKESLSSETSAPTVDASKLPVEAPKPLFGSFGTAPRPSSTPAIEAPKPLSFFGAAAADSTRTSSAPPSQAPTPVPAFTFGAPIPAASTSVEQPKPLFGAATESRPRFGSAPPAEVSSTLFGGSTGFSFGATAEKTVESKPAPATSFAFGATPTTPTTNHVGGFSFGTPTTPSAAPAPSAPSFSFGGGSSNAADVQRSPFAFGASAPINPSERPSTPPKNNDQEFMMEESPTREIHTNGASRPTLSFAFGNASSTGSTLFGAPAPPSAAATPSSPFGGFGASAPANPFSPAKPAEENKPFSFTGSAAPAPVVGSSFTFGPSKSTGSEAPRPASSGFGFGSAAPTPIATTAAFSFGNAATAAPNPFASTAAISTPSSPSTFNQGSPFNFNAPLPAQNTGFTFGSQPASPAGANTGLPATGFGAPSTGFGQAAPSSTFTAPAAIAPSTSAGSLFTIGAAPAPSNPNGRPTRKLPARRTGAKR